MRKCEIDISMNDGRVRHYEGPMMYLSYTSHGVCYAIDETDYNDKVLDKFNRDEIKDINIHVRNTEEDRAE